MSKLTQIYLIDKTKLALYSDIARNVGVDKVIPYVGLAQPFYIEEVLGAPLTAELIQQIATNTLTEANQALLLKIAPPLALYTQVLAMRGLTYSVVEKGITKLKSENSETLNSTELGQYINSTRENAEMALELLIRYLCECSDLYPLWRKSPSCNCDKYIKNEDGTDKLNREFHIYFPKKNNSCGCK